MYDTQSILPACADILLEMVTCPHRRQCIASCPSIKQSMLPFPDFIGRTYRGLVVIGANPGPGGNYAAEEEEMNALLRTYATDKSLEFYNKLLDYRNESSRYWDERNLCSNTMRQHLHFDLEDIAYLNIVKCKTVKTNKQNSCVTKNIGLEVSRKCSHLYLKRQLEILRPTHIIAQWKPIPDDLAKLGFAFSGYAIKALNGLQSWRYKPELSTGAIKPVFEQFLMDA